MKPYKGKYYIALYTGGPLNDEWCVGVYINIRELAQELNRDLQSTYQNFSHGRKHMVVNGMRCTIHFIPVDEDTSTNSMRCLI